MTRPKTLTLDIETSPNVAYIWKLWGDQYVGLDQLTESGEVISFAAKWYDKPKVHFYSVFHDGKEKMVEAAYEMINEADILIHFNGKKFDLPWLRSEFLLNGYDPHSPVQQVDLMQIARQNFRFPSYKLDYIAGVLGVGKKVKHIGFELWLKCMNSDAEAWAQMKKYNMHDVTITEGVYDKLRPWMKNHPHMGLYTGEAHCCPNCGSVSIQRRGQQVTNSMVYQRIFCNDCRAWSKDISEKVISDDTLPNFSVEKTSVKTRGQGN